MWIGIDGYNLAMPNGTGVASYGENLARTLTADGHRLLGVFGLPVPRDASIREVALFDAFKRTATIGRRSNRYQRAWATVRAFRQPCAVDVPHSGNIEQRAFEGMPSFDRIVSARHLFQDAFTYFRLTGRFVNLKVATPPEIMHWTYPVPVTMTGSYNIYTIHDLVPLKLPNTTLDDKVVYARMIKRCTKIAAQICTVSESSKQDIVSMFGIDPLRITNTYQTARPVMSVSTTSAQNDAKAVEGIFGLPARGYFIFCGAIEPKKNVGRLIEAYLSLQTSTPLVIVGARAWLSEGELRLLPGGGGGPGTYRGERNQTIIRLEYLPEGLLRKLMRGAKALIFPSLYEGFGLPVLEALQLGTPVITSNVSALPEVAGDAALFVDPYDSKQLIEAIRVLDEDDDLARDLSERGPRQAARFSAEQYQQRLTDLHQAAMAPR